jgi:hypothetical protein
MMLKCHIHILKLDKKKPKKLITPVIRVEPTQVISPNSWTRS